VGRLERGSSEGGESKECSSAVVISEALPGPIPSHRQHRCRYLSFDFSWVLGLVRKAAQQVNPDVGPGKALQVSCL